MRLAIKKTILLVLLTINAMNASADAEQKPIDLSKAIVATVGEIEFRECNIETASRDRTVQCAWLEVPENYQQPEGKKIRIFVARLPAKKPKGANEPILFLAGGPGQSASESYLHIDRAFADLAKERDFYLVDQRGTGHSNKLDCGDAVNDEALILNQGDSALIKELMTKCLLALPGDPRYYTTSVAIKDFEKVRSALGLKQWNLFGASYGTRVGLHYMRRYPDSIRASVLDSVLPPEHILGVDIAYLSQVILSHMYQKCEQNQECAARFPNLESEVNALFARLEKSPVRIQVENFSTGELENIKFTREHLASLIRLYLYNTKTLALLPPMLHEAAAKNNFSPIARAAKNVIVSMGNMLSLGMHNAVMCTEDIPYIDFNEELRKKHEGTYMGEGFMNDLLSLCEVWPKGLMDQDIKDTLKSDIPTLLLSGEYDPITPPDYADIVLKNLSAARHLVLKGQGHFVSVEGCAPDLVERFIVDANVDGLDPSCLDRLIDAPLFINFNGPSP